MDFGLKIVSARENHAACRAWNFEYRCFSCQFRAVLYIRIFLIMLVEFIFIRIIRNVSFVYSSFWIIIVIIHYFQDYIEWRKGRFASFVPFECRSRTTKWINKFNTSLNILLSITHILSGSISLSDQAYPKHPCQRILIKGKLFPNSRICSDLVQLHVHSFISKVILARIND